MYSHEYTIPAGNYQAICVHIQLYVYVIDMVALEGVMALAMLSIFSSILLFAQN